MAAFLKEPRNHAAYLTAAARQHNAQLAGGLCAWIIHRDSLTRRSDFECSYSM
jgi:hypothetical protein